jgi:folate-binding protein YgfZ
MSKDWNLIELGDLGVLRFRGADAVKFLQGQVSNDVERLSAERSQLAGYHNPQGRAIALLRLVQLAPDDDRAVTERSARKSPAGVSDEIPSGDVLAILPRELIGTVAARLVKFVLRAKVKIADETAGWRVAGLVAPHAAAARVGAGGAAGAGRVGASSVGAAGVGAAGGVGTSSVGASAVGASGSASVGAAGAAGTGSGASDELNADTAAEFEARATSWAATQFQQASAVAAAAGELSSAAAQLEEAESVVPLPTASALMLPDAVNSQSRSGASAIVRVGAVPARWLVISPSGEAAPLGGCVAADRDVWRLLDIADGEAQVYAATSEEFVAQMLNLDALDAIAFDKGCYTGQEVIARAHYRGRVKRRLQRFVSRGAVAKLAVGESGQLADGRAFKVVEAARLADGRWEFLAVAPLVGGAVEGAAEAAGTGAQSGSSNGQGVGATASVGQSAAAGAAPNAIAESAHSATMVIDAEVLPLPYPLPE